MVLSSQVGEGITQPSCLFPLSSSQPPLFFFLPQVYLPEEAITCFLPLSCPIWPTKAAPFPGGQKIYKYKKKQSTVSMGGLHSCFNRPDLNRLHAQNSKIRNVPWHQTLLWTHNFYAKLHSLTIFLFFSLLLQMKQMKNRLLSSQETIYI